MRVKREKADQGSVEKKGGEDHLYERERRARAIELFIRILAKERTKKTRYQVIAHEMVCLFLLGGNGRILQLAPRFSAGMLVVTRVDSFLLFSVQESNDLLLRNYSIVSNTVIDNHVDRNHD
jgi:hypothetical protein